MPLTGTLLALLLLAGTADDEITVHSELPGEGDRPPIILGHPAPPPSVLESKKRVAVTRRRARTTTVTAQSASTTFAGLRLVSMRPGQARIRLASGERTLSAGETLGRDVVKSIDGDCIVLTRAPREGDPHGGALVVVRFDARGRARVRVYAEKPGIEMPAEGR